MLQSQCVVFSNSYINSVYLNTKNDFYMCIVFISFLIAISKCNFESLFCQNLIKKCCVMIENTLENLQIL